MKFTTTQVTAVVGAISACAVAFGLHLNQNERDSIVHLALVLAPVLIAAEAALAHAKVKLTLQRENQEFFAQQQSLQTDAAQAALNSVHVIAPKVNDIEERVSNLEQASLSKAAGEPATPTVSAPQG